MSKDVSIVDMVVHLHPESSHDDRETIDAQLRALDGVVSVHFSEETHPHALIVAYNPDAVSSESVLGEIRNVDGKAVMANHKNRILEYLDRVELYEPPEKSKSQELYLNYYSKLREEATP